MMRVLSWVVPGGLVLGAAVALIQGVGPEGALARVGTGFPWIVYASAVLLAVYFHRSRVVALTLAIASLHMVQANGGGGDVPLFFAAGLLATSAGFLSLFKDRGLFSRGGFLQIGGLILLGVAGWLLVQLAPGSISALLEAMPFPAKLSLWSGLPQPVFLVFAGSMAVSVYFAARRDGAVEKGIAWSLLLVGLALSPSHDSASVAVYFMAAALVLGLSIVETSYAMAYRDDLTGLPARRALMRDLEGIGGVYSAAMVDVDHFKRFNDRYGHDVGDQVLRMVAGCLAKIPGGGRAYRYGGEEFTLLFSGKSVKEALPHLKNVCRTVEGSTFLLRSWRRPRKKPVDPGAWKGGSGRKKKRLSVTVSIGVADSGGGAASPDAVLKKADKALFKAKKAGRNRVSK